jgi:hypothetical protein
MSTFNNSNIRVSDLDFASIKSNFIEYLKSQAEFADYDFQASGMSILLDVMAYNTYYNSVLANFVANETFIDSAVKRNSVVAHAKSLGYRPKSVKSAKAKIQLTLTNAVGEPNQLVMKAGTPFETTVREQTFQFVTLNDIKASVDNSAYNFGEFHIYQGQFQQNTFVASGKKAEKFTLPNAGVDSSSIRVVVQTSATVLDYAFYNPSDTVVDIDGDSNTFFIQEGISGKAEIYFGDGVIGKQLAAGNIITVTYITSLGQSANDAKVFKLTGTIEGNSVVSVSTIETASGGADPEDIDSIRFNATTYFGVQNRAVTAGDYRALILQNFQNVKNVVTWGGEKQVPPEYGKVFVCIQPKNTDFLTDSEKAEVSEIVRKRAVANVSVKFLDPEYIDIELTTSVFYDPVKNDKNTLDLQNSVITAISQYGDNYLGNFDNTFRYSQLSRIIDNSDFSILNNLTSFRVFKSFIPVLSEYNGIDFIFNNSMSPNVYDPVVYSSGFYIAGATEKMFIKDNGLGILRLVYNDAAGVERVYDANVGTVKYDVGSISTKSLDITEYDGNEIQIFIKPKINDILSKNNNIVRLQSKNVTVNILTDSTENR